MIYITVKELISKLEKMSQTAKIKVPDWYSDETIFAEWVCENKEENTVSIIP